MPYKKLRIKIRDRVGYIFMSSGSRFNKLTIDTLKELKRAVAELATADEAVCRHALPEASGRNLQGTVRCL